MRSAGQHGEPRHGTAINRLLEQAEPTRTRLLQQLVDRLGMVGLHTVTRRDDRQDVVSDPGRLNIRGVTADSRHVVPESLFVAVAGSAADGHDFVEAAARAGAGAALVERPVPGVRIPQIVTSSTRRALAEAAAWWYGDPSRELGVIGITGTDGKTTTSLMASAALEAAGIPTGLLGTVATQIGGVREANLSHSTTSEAPVLQRALRAMVLAGDRAAVIETTSHGLAMDRVAAIDYDVAILTNLSHEHLELHGTFEAYRDAKRSLFDRLAVDAVHPTKTAMHWPRTGIVNADDPSAGAFIAATRAAQARLITYGRAATAEVRLTTVDDDGNGLRISYRTADGPATLRLQLSGRFNAHNALAVVALGRAIGLDSRAVHAGLEGLAGVPGRMEWIDRGQPFGVIVDYAHSPASLALVLDELGPQAASRGGGLIAVFGSAGERDREKRPMMGRVAADRCRIVIATDEDPRGEDRQAILAEIAIGAIGASAAPDAFLQIADRSAAIREAMIRARAGDVVLLAGKGHEATIEYADHEQPWNERGEAEAALKELGW